MLRNYSVSPLSKQPTTGQSSVSGSRHIVLEQRLLQLADVIISEDPLSVLVVSFLATVDPLSSPPNSSWRRVW